MFKKVDFFLQKIKKDGVFVQVMMKISELIPHPDNLYYFDDVEGERWTEILDSIRTSGIISPIIITPSKVIVSGNQRRRACEQLGIDEILCEVRTYESEEDEAIIKDLIESNICQRGAINGSLVKMGRIFDKLDEIYGVRAGNNQHESRRSHLGSPQKSKKEILNHCGVSRGTAHRAQKLSSTIPEVQEKLTSGDISDAVGLMIAKLTKEEQASVLAELDFDGSNEQQKKQVQEFTEKIAKLENEIDGYKKKLKLTKVRVDNEDYLKLMDEKTVLESKLADAKNKNASKTRENQVLKKKAPNEVVLEKQVESLQDKIKHMSTKTIVDNFRKSVDICLKNIGTYCHSEIDISKVSEKERQGCLEKIEKTIEKLSEIKMVLENGVDNKEVAA